MNATPARPAAEFLLKDIGQANIYRLELIKLMLAMATGLLAFTVSFRPSIADPDRSYLMGFGWLCLAASIAGGVFTMLLWEWFYISYRDYDNREKKSEGKAHRKTLTRWRRVCQFVQYAGLLAAVASIGWFAAINIDKPPRAPAGAAAEMRKG